MFFMTRSHDKEMDAAVNKAHILKALAHPVRVRIFESLANGEKTVGDIVEMLGEKEANTSRHLAVLRNVGLVTTRKEGLNVYYSNKMPCLISMLSCVDQAICDLADEHVRIASCLRNK
jgi:ArsR family transcriptional regulator, arsenate/arsenite/antimonite-responsive transcriptional repressor